VPHREAATSPSLTLLLPRLSGWIHQLDPAARYPALELLLARGRFGPPVATRIDALRMRVFGRDVGDEIPVAALGLLAAGCIPSDDRSYHLRLDPVTLQADMNRVMLLRTGFGGLPQEYRQAVEQALQQVFHEPAFADAGMELRASGQDEFWTISLPEHPGVEFTALDDALGADMFECLPAGEAGRPWRRLVNEMQMALHALPANEALRAQGLAGINGCWLWGGGSLPAASGHKAFNCVYSIDPVTSGLARLQQIGLWSLDELSRLTPLLQGQKQPDEARRRGASPDPDKSGVNPLLQEQNLPDEARRRGVSPDPDKSGVNPLLQEQNLPDEARRRGASPDPDKSGVNPLLQGRILVDWAVPAAAANAGLLLTPDSLENLCAIAVAGIKRSGGSIELHTPEFHCRMVAQDLRKFWRRPKPLAHQLQALLQSDGKAA
jgi:hypothetical protein